ncbi:MAG: MFS transporter [Nocardiopsaceae bacterium]|nr:MFS transporter [Nocardiopsaceae bacterium]
MRRIVIPRERPAGAAGKLAVLRHREFRRFYVGYSTSLLGSAMATVALTFAVLGSGGSAADLGYVFAAGVIPQVLFMLGGGVLADRMGRRKVMLGADAARLCAQGVLAGALLIAVPPIWLIVVLSALLGTGEAFFTPALGGLTPAITPREMLGDANALLGVAQSAARVAGPAISGVLIGLTQPGVVIGVDAATFGISLVSLALLAVPAMSPRTRSPWRDFAEGWQQFRAQAWLCVITVQFALFNLLTWAPFLLLGPLLAREYLGGARAWGAVTAAMALGSVLSGLALVGRSPRRPLIAAVIGSYGYAAPCLMLSLHLPVYAIAAGACAAGAGSAIFGTYFATVQQQRVPPEALARVTAFSLTGAYALGSAGFVVIGPVGTIVGAGRMLGFAAAYTAVSSTVVLSLRAIRSVRQLETVPVPRE